MPILYVRRMANGYITGRLIPTRFFACRSMVGLRNGSLAVWGRWIVSSEFRPVPAGPDPVPTASLVTLRGLEVGGLLLTGWMLGHFLVAPWRRAGANYTGG